MTEDELKAKLVTIMENAQDTVGGLTKLFETLYQVAYDDGYEDGYRQGCENA